MGELSLLFLHSSCLLSSPCCLLFNTCFLNLTPKLLQRLLCGLTSCFSLVLCTDFLDNSTGLPLTRLQSCWKLLLLFVVALELCANTFRLLPYASRLVSDLLVLILVHFRDSIITAPVIQCVSIHSLVLLASALLRAFSHSCTHVLRSCNH